MIRNSGNETPCCLLLNGTVQAFQIRADCRLSLYCNSCCDTGVMVRYCTYGIPAMSPALCQEPGCHTNTTTDPRPASSNHIMCNSQQAMILKDAPSHQRCTEGDASGPSGRLAAAKPSAGVDGGPAASAGNMRRSSASRSSACDAGSDIVRWLILSSSASCSARCGASGVKLRPACDNQGAV